jgi:hypothetical protein
MNGAPLNVLHLAATSSAPGASGQGQGIDRGRTWSLRGGELWICRGAVRVVLNVDELVGEEHLPGCLIRSTEYFSV